MEPRWTYTYPQEDTRHEAEDLVGWIGGRKAGRVYPYPVGGGIIWKWFSWAEGVVPNSGSGETRLAAMMAVERNWR